MDLAFIQSRISKLSVKLTEVDSVIDELVTKVDYCVRNIDSIKNDSKKIKAEVISNLDGLIKERLNPLIKDELISELIKINNKFDKKIESLKKELDIKISSKVSSLLNEMLKTMINTPKVRAFLDEKIKNPALLKKELLERKKLKGDAE